MRFLSVWLIGTLIAVATGQNSTAPEATTLDPITEQNNEINEKLEQILLTLGQGHSSHNNEFNQWLQTIRDVKKLSQNRLTEKVRAHALFTDFNRRRLELEEEIDERLDELVDDLIPSLQQNSKCAKFYRRQRDILRRAVTATNARKTEKIRENSVKCPHKEENDDSNEDDDLMFSDAADSGSVEV
ncbi:uncharacterized protein Dwil_GK27689 [Drosophila willistoni]|uniref:Uncharacterized protein n=1 Tax=Drosophila willistoni TaxID=7260 RepID=A0A0Q9X2D0_DROWI|nr:uncharacterized protein LOC26529691 [Drosophila willistoni]KRF98407.1 uncharacterized protein Dwil_GK27689 [Drosophila willistoni]